MTTATAYIAQLEADTRYRLETAAREARGLEGALDTWEQLFFTGEWAAAANFWRTTVAPLLAAAA